MNIYLGWTLKQIAAEYRACYANHQELAQGYADGYVSDQRLRQSADNLKELRAAHRVTREAAQVRTS